jgi:predicted dehydrogenase
MISSQRSGLVAIKISTVLSIAFGEPRPRWSAPYATRFPTSSRSYNAGGEEGVLSGLRVAVVGAGYGSTVHVPGFQSEGWDVVALWSRRLERAREQATTHGVAEATDDFPALVRRPDIDALAIATPPAGHYELVMAAIASGKHVLVEKPFALDAAQAREMCESASAAGITAMVGHEFRFSPQRLFIKQLLDEGYVGTPQLAQVEHGRARHAAATASAQPRR